MPKRLLRSHPVFDQVATLVALALLFSFLQLGCREKTEEPLPVLVEVPPPEGTPRLVLWLVVDQVRGDYFDRFGPVLEGGLARLAAEGAHFIDAHHYHSATVTGAGHATLSTGALPRNHGVVGNGWWDRSSRKEWYTVEDEEFGRAPTTLESSTLGDFLKAKYPSSKVFGIGGKDRSAILSGGREADGAWWYDSRTGGYQTSEYYPVQKPQWLEEFHDRHLADQWFSKPWTPLLSIEELADRGIGGIEAVDRGPFTTTFPHVLGGLDMQPERSYYAGVYGSPFIDELTIELAKALIEGENLGGDEYPDILAVTLSATDAVGHRYGPDSPELVDSFMRTDRAIGGLLAYVDRVVGLDQTIVMMSSDHGVGRIPELVAKEGGDGKRAGTAEITCFQQVGKQLEERFGPEDWFPFGLYLDRDLVAEKGLDLGEVRAFAAALLERCPRIDRVLLSSELQQESSPDPIVQLFQNSYHRERSADLSIVAARDTLFTSSVAASHGSPWEYDTHVPIILRAPGIRSGRIADRVHTIDVAPTVASMLGLDAAIKMDGKDRTELLGIAPTVAEE